MKKHYLLTFLLCSLISWAQIPAGYYSTATGSGYTLKTQLFNIINNQTDLGYSGLWVTYQTSDRDVFTGTGYENDNTIYDMYTENPTGSAGECGFIYATDQDTGTGGGSECDVYNREHIVPQSIFSQAAPMRHDAHFVTPTDKKVNGALDITVPSNVKNAINYSAPKDSFMGVFVSGGQASAKDSKSTNLINIKLRGVGHTNIDNTLALPTAKLIKNYLKHRRIIK